MPMALNPMSVKRLRKKSVRLLNCNCGASLREHQSCIFSNDKIQELRIALHYFDALFGSLMLYNKFQVSIA